MVVSSCKRLGTNLSRRGSKVEFGYCNICKKHLMSSSDFIIKNGKKICLQCASKSQANSNNELQALIDYMKKVYKKTDIPDSWMIYIDKLIKQGRTYSGIRGTLYYWYELQGNTPDYYSMSEIGIVDFVYEEASKFFAELEEINNHNRNLEYKPIVKVIETTKEEEQSKSNIRIEDL